MRIRTISNVGGVHSESEAAEPKLVEFILTTERWREISRRICIMPVYV